MERGQVWRYTSALGRGSDLRLIVSANEICYDNELTIVLALVVEDSDPGGLLAVQVGNGVWASALTIAPHAKSRFAELVDTCDTDTMDQVAVALRAAQAL